MRRDDAEDPLAALTQPLIAFVAWTVTVILASSPHFLVPMLLVLGFR